MQKSDLIRKIRLILKFMTSQPGKQTIAMYISPNISRSKSNQAIKFSQLTEYNMGNIKSQERLFPHLILNPDSKVITFHQEDMESKMWNQELNRHQNSM